MVYIESNSMDAKFNFALEKYLINTLDVADSYFLFWNTNPTLMIGKFQNTISEINKAYADKKNITVVRRISGGGAIYTDPNGWQFSFINKKLEDSNLPFCKFTKPIIEALKTIGVTAYNSGRNDILVDGKKISGNAQYKRKGVNLHHGSLLFNTDLEELVRTLNVDDEKIISKGIKSVKERVANISDYLQKKISSYQFRDLMIEFLTKGMDVYKLRDRDIKNINKIKEEQFNTWEWNYGKSPKFNRTKDNRLKGGRLCVKSFVEGGFINNIDFFGDFFEMRDLSSLRVALKGTRYKKSDIKEVLSANRANEYFYQISINDILDLII